MSNSICYAFSFLRSHYGMHQSVKNHSLSFCSLPISIPPLYYHTVNNIVLSFHMTQLSQTEDAKVLIIFRIKK